MKIWKNGIAALAAGAVVSGTLAGCSVSDDPATNALATAATIGAAGVLLSNMDNGYDGRHDSRRGYYRNRNNDGYRNRPDWDWDDDRRDRWREERARAYERQREMHEQAWRRRYDSRPANKWRYDTPRDGYRFNPYTPREDWD